MRVVVCASMCALLSLTLASCGMEFPSVSKIFADPHSHKPIVESVPDNAQLPKLRIFECDRDHCHQIFRVSPDVMGGKFFLEGVHEPDTLMDFIDEKSFFFYSPTGPAVRKMADGGPIMVTPFTYVHRFMKAGSFHVIFRRTRCGGRTCDYLAQNKPPPPDQAAEFWISSEKPYQPPPPKAKHR